MSGDFGSTMNMPNGLTALGYFQATGVEGTPLNLSGGGRLHVRARPDAYNAFYFVHVRFDGIRFESDGAEGVMYTTVFGTYPADVDQMTLRASEGMPEESTADFSATWQTVYIDGLTFLSPPDPSHYHLRATGGIQVDILNVTPATAGTGARWIAENGAQVVWGEAPNIGVGSLTLEGPLYYNDVLSINTYGYLNNGNLPELPEFTVRMQVYDAQTHAPIESIPEHSVTATSANWDQLTDVYIPIPGDLWEQHPLLKVRWIVDATNTVDETNEGDNVFFTDALDITPVDNNRIATGATRRVVPAPQPRARPVHPKVLQ